MALESKEKTKNASASLPRIVIAGSGLAGLSLGLALKHGLGDDVTVTVCDPSVNRDPGADTRAYSIAAAGRKMFEALGIWTEIAPHAQAIRTMTITDSRLRDPVRPTYLSFSEDERTDEPLGHMVEARCLTPVLMSACRQADVEFIAATVERFETEADCIHVHLSGMEPIRSQMLVAADGGRSRLRSLAGIGWVGWPYGQTAIVATLKHERPHEGEAVQHFLPSGPFAILPLCDGDGGMHRSLIVWSERKDIAADVMSLDQDMILEEVERRFGGRFGALQFIGSPKAFPLSFGTARRFFADRFALLGDAAHVVHPIAGQGLNLGLGDVAALAEEIVDAARLGLDVGSEQVLTAYERYRRADTAAMSIMTDSVNRLFSNDFLPLRLLRDLGLGTVDRLAPVKEFFMREAAHADADTPRLMRGEVL